MPAFLNGASAPKSGGWIHDAVGVSDAVLLAKLPIRDNAGVAKSPHTSASMIRYSGLL
jgi:hypothetical protein